MDRLRKVKMLVRSLVILLALLGTFWNPQLATAADTDGPVADTQITRIAIPLRPGLGKVHFPITHTQRETQVWFDQGIALLHGDDRSGADRSFFQAVRLEPDCPMAWWGLAIANEGDRPLAAYYARAAAQGQATVSDRERLWINALKVSLESGTSEVDRRTYLVTAYDRIATQFPDDLEAYAFLARQLIQNRDAGMPLPATTTADLTIDRVLRENPDHPSLHYKLQLWLDQHPERAVDAAQHVQKVLPAQPRVLNTAGKLYAALGRPGDALACLERSLTIVQARLAEDRMTLFEIPGTVENAAIQIDQLVRLGRVHEAVSLAQRMIDSPYPQLPAVGSLASTTRSAAGSAAHMMRVELKPRSAGPTHPTRTGQAKLLEILIDLGRWNELLDLAGRGYFASPDPEIQWRAAHAQGLAGLSRRDTAEIERHAEQLRNLLDRRRAAAASGRVPEEAAIKAAVQELEWCAAASREPTASECPSSQLALLFPALCPPATPEPTTLRTPRLTVAQHVSLIRQLAAAGSTESAAREFETLVSQVPQVDRDILACSGLQIGTADHPIVQVQQYPVRSEVPAPALSLPDRHGRTITLDSLRGKPVVLVFYLGAGCPHCIEQLRSFAPLKDDYEQAGVAIVAVSTDSVAGLQKTFEVAGAEEIIPFQLVSDETLRAFRDFGAYDERDQKPLHGTFLIDPEGRILWHNIRREPFMATRSLLDEAVRIGTIQSQSAASPRLGVSRSRD